jgi:antitoxin HicB
MEFPARFKPQADGGFVTKFPDFGGRLSQGDNEADGRRMARDLIVTLVRSQIQAGTEVLRPRKTRGRDLRMIRMSALHSIKVEIYNAFLASGLRKAALARRLAIPKTVVEACLTSTTALGSSRLKPRSMRWESRLTSASAMPHRHGPGSCPHSARPFSKAFHQ